jgi:hypothetical protein
MASYTTAPSPFLLNINSLNNVITSASGNNVNDTTLSNLTLMVNTTTNKVSANTISPFSGSNINITGNLNLSNSGIYFNGRVGVTSNCINGSPYLAIKTANVEHARFTSNGFAIGNTVPETPLDVTGSVLVRGCLYVSTMGEAFTSSLGCIYADGSVFGDGFYSPSDERLKTNVRLYEPRGLPDAVRFNWTSTGVEDIGVIAQNVAAIAPECVSSRNGTLTVDYSKLVVLCLAEISALKKEIDKLKQ